MKINNEIDLINCNKQYFGVGFIKSRKSDDKIMDISEDMMCRAQRKSLRLVDIIVDSSSGEDIDRSQIDKLVAWMEKEYIKAIVVKSILDITKDSDDLAEFMRKAELLGVSVYSIEAGTNLILSLDNGKWSD